MSDPIWGPEPAPPAPHRIYTAAEFEAAFVPPDWLIAGILQRGRLYSCTSLTGHGKTAVWLFNACMIQAGRMVGHLHVTQGNALILAGENPADLQARYIGIGKALRLSPAQKPRVLPKAFPMNDAQRDQLCGDVEALDMPLSLIVVDTAAAYYPGEDENDNAQAGYYARTLRTLTELPGNPAVVVLAHPTKNACRDNLLPRGGGAFLNEVDGNLTLWSDAQGEATGLHWQGKIRGPDFTPLHYKLRPVDTGLLDNMRCPVWTIVADVVSEEEVADRAKQSLANADAVLISMSEHPEWSVGQIARDLGWLTDADEPLKSKVYRIFEVLAGDKLIAHRRKGAPWTITPKGAEIVAEINLRRHAWET